MDSSDNIYITGYTTSYGAGGDDIFILKYKKPQLSIDPNDENENNNSNKKIDNKAYTNVIVISLITIVLVGICIIITLIILYKNSRR